MVPDRHVHRDVVDVGFDFAARATEPNTPNEDRTALVAAKRADRVVARNLHAGCVAQGTRKVDRMLVLKDLLTDNRRDARKRIDFYGCDHRISCDDDGAECRSCLICLLCLRQRGVQP